MRGHLLLVAITVIFLSFGFLWIGAKLWGTSQSRLRRLILLSVSCLLSIPGLLFTFYYTHVFDGTAWFYDLRIFPYSELFASCVGLLAGILLVQFEPEGRIQRAAIPIGLAAFLAVPYLKPLLDPVDLDRLKTSCPDEVCLQSTPATCGPNSVATILKTFGDTVSEKQIAEEVFTSHSGTEIWYLARALQHRGFSTRVVLQAPNQLDPPLPSVAGVVLPGGVGHFIAIIRKNGDQFTLADPLKGKMDVQRSDLTSTYHFTGFFLAVTKNAQSN